MAPERVVTASRSGERGKTERKREIAKRGGRERDSEEREKTAVRTHNATIPPPVMMDFTYVPEPANQKQQQTMFMV